MTNFIEPDNDDPGWEDVKHDDRSLACIDNDHNHCSVAFALYCGCPCHGVDSLEHYLRRCLIQAAASMPYHERVKILDGIWHDMREALSIVYEIGYSNCERDCGIDPREDAAGKTPNPWRYPNHAVPVFNPDPDLIGNNEGNQRVRAHDRKAAATPEPPEPDPIKWPTARITNVFSGIRRPKGIS